ncbi:MAG: YceI family protein [Acidimicrobiales bacterium]|nr:YceI family protein [Acidimicrobiales bacterium]
MSMIETIKQRWQLVLAGAVVVVLLVVVGGPDVYIHFIEGKPPAKLSLSSNGATASDAPGTSRPSSGPIPTTADGTWQATSASQAGYRVKETLFGQSTTAVGRTNKVTGSIAVKGTTVSTASFSVDMTSVSSDRPQRDGQFRGRIMQTDTFPTATFTLTSPIGLATTPAQGKEVSATATGKLMLHGTTRTVTFPVKAVWTGATVKVNGEIPLTFADYGVNNPSGGPAKVGDHGTLEFLLVLGPG